MEEHSGLSQSNNNSDINGEGGNIDISLLIPKLRSENDLIRMQARETLIYIGKSTVAELVKALSNDDPQLRWEIVKVLKDIKDDQAIPALVKSLKDENASVRWTAADALVKFRRTAIPPILEALIRESSSIWLRQGAHHILHVMKDRGELVQAEEKVFEALEDVEPMITVPWAAEKALESLQPKKR
jgi:HEAT repeat protein